MAISLHSQAQADFWGAIRYASLIKVHLPEWILRVYISNSSNYRIPDLIQAKLRSLGAQIVGVPDISANVLPPNTWSYLVADDPSVDVFIVRNGNQRLGGREATSVNQWVASNTSFHCLRDHVSHEAQAVVDGLWGAKRLRLIQLLGNSALHSLIAFVSQSSQTSSATASEFLTRVIWPKVDTEALCHDSVSCRQWPGAEPFPTGRANGEYAGATFDQHERIMTSGYKMLGQNSTRECET